MFLPSTSQYQIVPLNPLIINIMLLVNSFINPNTHIIYSISNEIQFVCFFHIIDKMQKLPLQLIQYNS